MAKKRPSAEIRAYWNRVAGLGCILSEAPNPTLHHCHGGSMREVGVMKAKGAKTSDWLVIPLDAKFHVGQYGIDLGHMTVPEWEARFGRQVDLLDKVVALLGVDVWAKAGVDRNKETA